MAATGEGERDLDVWRVTTWYGDGVVWCAWSGDHILKNACGEEDSMMLGVHQNLRTNAFFGLLQIRISVISFVPDFLLAVNDNQVIWAVYNFFQEFFYWPFIMIYLTLELL